MTTRRSHTIFATVRTEGGLLPPDLLERILRQDPGLEGLTAKDYHLAEGTRLMAKISESWGEIQTRWASFRRTKDFVQQEHGTGTSETRSFVQDVLRELGYGELRSVRAAETVGGRSFLISHRAGEAENAPPLEVVSFLQALDEPMSRTGGGERRSPQALLQGYLNASDHLWGIVTNGLLFRLLRENRQIDRVLRVDFDLEGMLDAENFAEFQLFWLILHRSRFVQPGERRENAWLERWSQTAASEGTRALTGLRDGVEQAIEAIGQGLLTHPDNAHLQQQLKDGRLTVDAYYSELLRLVYRLLFLLVAEERGLLFNRPADGELTAETRAEWDRIVARYRKFYSIERLREEATRIRDREAHYDDLWRGLLVTFDAMRFTPEAKALGLEPLGGGLFDSGSCPHVADNAAPGTTSGDRTAGRPMLSNAALLDAIEALSEVTRDGVTRRINYRDLDVEELGSVYEGLLEHRPALEPLANGGYRFGFSESASRKETGSYYTPRSLVQELLNSALDPVIDAALAKATTAEGKARALLDVNVCDPACGSGHFLLGAARRIGRRLAEVRAGEDREPEPDQIRHATAEAIRHCVYGVDKNPLAVDLCKVALWIESHEPGRPLGFLDHHIKRGDSLVGVFDLDVLHAGIPDGAYTPVTADDKTVARDLKARNTAERPKETRLGNGRTARMRNASLFDEGERDDIMQALAARLNEIDALPETTVEEVRAKADAYARLHGRDDWQALTIACDLWTWAFFAPLTKAGRALVPTSATVRQQIEQGTVPGNITGAAQGAGARIGFFHWRLAFPDVFSSARGGFDAVLGNPPWERVKLQEKEFFATLDPAIANAPNKAARDRLIAKLPETNPALAEAFDTAKREAENASLFMRTSGRFPLTGRGDVNLYSVFAEQFRTMLARTGQAGIIVPTGIATDDTNKYFFADLVNRASLVALYDFENRRGIFEGVHRSYKFSILVLAGSGRQDVHFQAGFFLFDPAEIHEPDRTFLLGAEDIALLNPNTRTCPIFRSARDAELTKAIYRATPVLIDESEGEKGNPWAIRFMRMFDMTNDSYLFLTAEETTAQGATLHGNTYANPSEIFLPMWEDWMMHQYEHRYQSNGGIETTLAQHQDPAYTVLPRYWVKKAQVRRKAGELFDDGYFIAFRNRTRATDVRSVICTVIPLSAVGNTVPLLVPGMQGRIRAGLIANLSSFVLDYVARQKIGGMNLNFFIVKQFPVFRPETYTEDLLDLIVPRVLELTYTAYDMTPFARDLGYEGPPFVWDEERRARLRAELDGIYAHLYGVSRDDFAYILDTFPIVARKDIDQYGEYRTKRLCLEAYDHFAPETLRALELEVREIEQTLRQLITRALDNDPAKLLSDHRDELLAQRVQHRGNRASDTAPSLRDLLDSAYLKQLDKIVRSDAAWPEVESRIGPRKDFKQHIFNLSEFRNPLAHGRGMDEAVRDKGEGAIAWFRARLRLDGVTPSSF